MKTSTLSTTIGVLTALGIAGFAMAQDRGPTKGRIPEDAFEEGRIKVDKVPDYIVSYARDGAVAGYMRKTDFFGSEELPKRIAVFDETLSRVVGHMVVNRGFVPIGTPDEAIPEFKSRDLTPDELEAITADLPSTN